MFQLSVLYDGWPLIHQPHSPQALHLLALLSHLPEPLQAWVALPGRRPAWLPQRAQALAQALPDTPMAHLLWEQRFLPKLRRQVGAQVLHLTSFHPPLLDAERCLVSPASYERVGQRLSPWPGVKVWQANPRAKALGQRLRQAFSAGAMASLGGILWPQDLPPYSSLPQVAKSAEVPVRAKAFFRLPPLPYPLSEPPAGSSLPPVNDLPEAYILYHAAYDPFSLRRLLDVWEWVARSLGEGYPLLLAGVDEQDRDWLIHLLAEYDLTESVRLAPPLTPPALGEVYRRATALFHPLPLPPWGDVLRMALASGLAVVAIEEPLTDATVGPAAYLAAQDDRRHLAAALITVIVEEEVAQHLSQAGRERAAPWSDSAFRSGLLEVYQTFVEGQMIGHSSAARARRRK